MKETMKTLSLLFIAATLSYGQTTDANPRQLVTKAFADLGAAVNGQTLYCSNCTAANPVASGGTGVIVRGENGAWNGGSGSGSPGGSTTQLQYNNAGAFGGLPAWTVADGGQRLNGASTVANATGTTALQNLSGTYTIAAGATPIGDVKLSGGNLTVSGTAQSGSTWSFIYDTCNFTLTTAGSVLTHPLCNVFRQNLTTAASTTTSVAATVYVTNDAQSVAGTVTTMSGVYVTNGGVMNGTGTIGTLTGITVGGPTALTGGLTLDSQIGALIQDIAGAGAGTIRQSVAIGGPISFNAGLAITVAGATTAGTNYGIYNYARNNFHAGAIIGDGNINTFWNGGAYTKAERYLMVATNTQPAFATFYNGVGGWDMGLTTTGSRFGIVNSSAVENFTMLTGATARVGIAQTTPAFELDVTGTGNFTKGVITVPSTVAALPASPTKGQHAFVSDSNAASCTAGIGAIVAAGGSTNCPVFYDGTNWRIG
tara:strand:+ start:2283 stop:3731 length:1449 start_codon:yes stop_codon:yes gene_type:complete